MLKYSSVTRKYSTIKEFPKPKVAAKLKTFLGMVNFYIVLHASVTLVTVMLLASTSIVQLDLYIEVFDIVAGAALIFHNFDQISSK